MVALNLTLSDLPAKLFSLKMSLTLIPLICYSLKKKLDTEHLSLNNECVNMAQLLNNVVKFYPFFTEKRRTLITIFSHIRYSQL